jgi:hypothetical protein
VKDRSRKTLAPILAASILLYSPAAFALTGGPFDNGYSPNASAGGTYAGVITGKNLTGLVQFGVSDISEQTGRFAVFHEGIMSYGVCNGIADPANQRVAGALLGVAALPGETTGASGNPGTSFQTITVRASAEGAFTAEMQGFPVAITFEGKGEISTVSSPTTVTDPTAGDVVIISAPGTADNGNTNDPQTVTGQATSEIQGTTLRATTPFEIRGSRTSLTVFAPYNSFAAVPPVLDTSAEPTPIPVPVP